MASRPAIPAAMKRLVQAEAGYRCAVPTCRDKGPFDFEHIKPWSEVKRHEEHNIILLCVGCHARVTRGEISKEAIQSYKRNLAIITGRYSLYEMRLLELFSGSTGFSPSGEIGVDVQSLHMIRKSELLHFSGLLRDGYVEIIDNGVPPRVKEQAERAVRASLSNMDSSGKHTDLNMDEDELRQFYLDVSEARDGGATISIWPTAKGIEFMSNYFNGVDVE